VTVETPRRRQVITGNHAVSHGARLARAQVISAYPITPQTQIVELLSQFCDEGLLDAKFIKVESEHSAMAALVGASTTGARTFTATSAHGLALMHEMLHWAAGSRLPIVLANVNRAMGAPWSIWADQNDSLSQRDTGWIQIYCECNQEVLDSVLQAYRVAETVQLPAMIVLDAFVLSHTAEPVEIPDQGSTDTYLPPYRPALKLDTASPRAFGGLATPDTYMEFRFQIQAAMNQALHVFEETGEEFHRLFGRRYGLVEGYRVEGAETLLITSGTVTSTAREVIDGERVRGRRVGLLKIRVFRPFPAALVRAFAAEATRIAVIDRNIGFGVGGIFAQEVRAALHNHIRVPVYGYVAGLGGRDISPETILEVLDRTAESGRPEDVSWVGVME
jgi:pyruvate/2-oxoacid:ferredoxin oxidoreductase alpha subunit